MRPITKALAVAGITLGLSLGAANAALADRPDSWVTLKTRLALMTADSVDTWDLNVDTSSGVVTLHGKVASDVARAEAERIAKGIEGVTSVKNLLQVVPRAQRDVVNETDDVVKAAVEKALEAHQALADVDVASVNKGVVLLAGTVDTLESHVTAVETARRVRGVRGVSSNITTKSDTE